VIGIDIGYSSVNVAQAALYQGRPTIIKALVELIGPVEDAQREKATSEALKKVLAHFDTRHADIVCTVSHQKTIVDYITMPRMPEGELADAIKIEVGNSQHFAIDDPVFDFHLAGHVAEKNAEKTSVIVAAVARSSIDSLLAHFPPLDQDRLAWLKKVLQVPDFMGLNLVRVIPVSIALENVIKISQQNKKETIVVLEMGSMSAELDIYRDGYLEFSRRINITGFDFIQCLTSALSTSKGKVELTLEEAQWVWKKFGIPSAGEEYLIPEKITANQAISLLRPKLEQLIREITRFFDFYYDKNRGDKIDRLVLSGAGTMLKRLPEFLNAELGLPAGLGNSFQDVTFLHEGMLDDLEMRQRLTVAIGAALSDGKGINLLPQPLRDSRKKFGRKILLGATAIVVLLASVFFYASLLVQLNLIAQKNEYQSLMPAIQGVKDDLSIQKIAHHRADMGGLFRLLSHLPPQVFLSDLNFDQGSFTLSGVVLAKERDAKKILKPLLFDLKKIFPGSVKISTIQEDAGHHDRSTFIIEAK
jgi:type IV pilus assembly protein PilM